MLLCVLFALFTVVLASSLERYRPNQSLMACDLVSWKAGNEARNRIESSKLKQIVLHAARMQALNHLLKPHRVSIKMLDTKPSSTTNEYREDAGGSVVYVTSVEILKPIKPTSKLHFESVKLKYKKTTSLATHIPIKSKLIKQLIKNNQSQFQALHSWYASVAPREWDYAINYFMPLFEYEQVEQEGPDVDWDKLVENNKLFEEARKYRIQIVKEMQRKVIQRPFKERKQMVYGNYFVSVHVIDIVEQAKKLGKMKTYLLHILWHCLEKDMHAFTQVMNALGWHEEWNPSFNNKMLIVPAVPALEVNSKGSLLGWYIPGSSVEDIAAMPSHFSFIIPPMKSLKAKNDTFIAYLQNDIRHDVFALAQIFELKENAEIAGLTAEDLAGKHTLVVPGSSLSMAFVNWTRLKPDPIKGLSSYTKL